ncbi:hypothetical protein SSP35_17_00040 [Streptomyces sp. NBRC 110611]|uniref:hypothetical protein n=1 Tax=Streptomyces sp. NBRC 110611 TaxID=1621259 RepID=UPI00082FA37D|nr:hypothetical protein [Streptomyces sp. NBRC 110611]GAU70151.1 hypothetical protein SSP35_17_00040 [Streptomyces sp. NBRC 110611]
MRKGTGTPAPRLWRTVLTVLAVALALLLGGTATAAGASAALAAKKPSPTMPATKPSYDSKEEKTKREKRDSERGQPRGGARTVSSPESNDPAQRPTHIEPPDAAAPSGHPAAHHTTKAVSRLAQLPVLHCVFRC